MSTAAETPPATPTNQQQQQDDENEEQQHELSAEQKKKKDDSASFLKPMPYTREGQAPELIPCFQNERKLPFLKRNLQYIRRCATMDIYDGSTCYAVGGEYGETTVKPWQFHTVRDHQQMYPNVTTLFRKDAMCPLCGFAAFDVESLWLHMTTFNRSYKFSAMRDKEGTLHIAANPNVEVTARKRRVEQLDYTGKHTQLIYWGRGGKIFSQKISSKGFMYKAYLPEPQLSEAISDNHPKRDYYHPLGFNKTTMGEWMLLDKLDPPGDETWKLRIANSLLEEFNDVSDREKAFIKLWNDFVRGKVFIPEHSLKYECINFITAHAHVIKRFEENMISHVENLWEEHQLLRDDMLEIMQHFGEVVSASEPPVKDVIMTPQIQIPP